MTDAPADAPTNTNMAPRLLSCNVGTWGRVWRIALGSAIAASSALAIAAAPQGFVVIGGLAGVFAGSFMVFEGMFSWCVLRAIAGHRAPNAPPEA